MPQSDDTGGNGKLMVNGLDIHPPHDHVYHRIGGWFDWLDTYRRWAREIPFEGIIVEVGVYQGKSMSFLLVELANLDRHDVTIHAVDSWYGVDGQPDELRGPNLKQLFLSNIEPLPLQPVVHHATSYEAAAQFAPASVDRVWLDGAHDFDSVYVDLEIWWSRLKIGGEIGGHDLSPLFPGVREALTKWCAERRLMFRTLGPSQVNGPTSASWMMVKTRG